MTRGVRLYLVGSIVLVSLAGCGRGFFQAEREPWRGEAEAACMKSGAVKEGPELVRVDPISGPGVCGAEFPLRVAALGEVSGSFGYVDEPLRPPGDIAGGPRWPISQSPPPPLQAPYPSAAPRQQTYGAPASGPISLAAPGIAPQDDEIDLPSEGAPEPPATSLYRSTPSYPPRGRAAPYSSAPYATQAPPRLGPARGNAVTALGPVAIRPTATLACPIVSELQRWLADSVQPAAQRWFGSSVVEIKQISAYSCRGRNGDHSGRISEHAFGNALDIAAFVLADGRRVVVEGGWRGLPEEQGFLRDVQAAACHHFTTVLAPGSNSAHYNHIHVDLRRRAGRDICSPQAMSGDEIAMRAGGGLTGRRMEDPAITGSIHRRRTAKQPTTDDEDDE